MGQHASVELDGSEGLKDATSTSPSTNSTPNSNPHPIPLSITPSNTTNSLKKKSHHRTHSSHPPPPHRRHHHVAVHSSHSAVTDPSAPLTPSSPWSSPFQTPTPNIRTHNNTPNTHTNGASINTNAGAYMSPGVSPYTPSESDSLPLKTMTTTYTPSGRIPSNANIHANSSAPTSTPTPLQHGTTTAAGGFVRTVPSHTPIVSARSPSTHADNMYHYLSTLLQQAESQPGHSQPHDIERLKQQLQAVTEVTQRQQAAAAVAAQQQFLLMQHQQQQYPMNTHPQHPSFHPDYPAVTSPVRPKAKRTRLDPTYMSHNPGSMAPVGGGGGSGWAPSAQDIALVNSSFDLPLAQSSLGITEEMTSLEKEHHQLLYGEVDEEGDLAPWSPIPEPRPIYPVQPYQPLDTYSNTNMSRVNNTALSVGLPPQSHQQMDIDSFDRQSSVGSSVMSDGGVNAYFPSLATHAPSIPQSVSPPLPDVPSSSSSSSSSSSQGPPSDQSTPTTSSSSSNSSTNSRASVTSLSTFGPVLQNYSGMSKVFLANYISADVLSILEREYGAGNFSAAAVRQHLMWLTAALEPEDQQEFLAQFSKLEVAPYKGGALHSACTRARQEAQAAAAMAANANAVTSTNGTKSNDSTQSSALTNEQVHYYANRQMMRAFGKDLSPLEAAPDDIDGVARVRITILFSVPPATAAVVNAAHKRKKLATPAGSGADDISLAQYAPLSQHNLPPATSSSTNGGTLTAPAAATDEPIVTSTCPPTTGGCSPEFQMHRMIQVNKAFERLSLYTQKEMVEMLHNLDLRILFKHVRSDHLAALHSITMKWRLHSVSEGHMYQVRVDKNNRETYCLVHINVHLDQGMFLGGVQSIIPLPDDPNHPPPPFVEGVDLDEETLLYGYKPNRQ